MIPLFKVFIPPKEDLMESLERVIYSGYIGQGKKVEEFEAVLSNFIGNKYCLTLNTCTSAIQLALRLAGATDGAEVITTAMTCTATNEPILAERAKIVWADINSETGNIDAQSIKEKITAKTKAIVVVHWGGNPVDLDAINGLAKERDLAVIEDAAHAFGAEYNGVKIGNHSDFVCFSFQAIKHITTIDGGALFCRRKDDYQRGKLLRWYGIDRESPRTDFRCEADILEWGYKFHMHDVAATIGLTQMNWIKKILENRREIAAYYDRELAAVDGLKLSCVNQLGTQSAYWLYTILVERRDDFVKHMADRGVATSRVHERNDGHTMFREFRCPLPNIDKFVKSMICIPIGFWVDQEAREHIVHSIKEGW